VQVGSDSQLVAPVTIGDDAYVATGTTVRKDVPAGALVFNSKTESQRRGWVAARRAREARAQRRARPPAKGRVKGETKKAQTKRNQTKKARGPKTRSQKARTKGRPQRPATTRKRTTREPSKRASAGKKRRR